MRYVPPEPEGLKVVLDGVTFVVASEAERAALLKIHAGEQTPATAPAAKKKTR